MYNTIAVMTVHVLVPVRVVPVLYKFSLTYPSPAERVLHLEADLRRSEITIQSLQQELAVTKLAQTPTTDTHRYQLGARGQGLSPPPGAPRSVEEVAVIVTETSVAKGIVQQTLT